MDGEGDSSQDMRDLHLLPRRHRDLFRVGEGNISEFHGTGTSSGSQDVHRDRIWGVFDRRNVAFKDPSDVSHVYQTLAELLVCGGNERGEKLKGHRTYKYIPCY